MLEQIPTTVPQQPKKPCKNDRKTMLKKQALARYNFFLYFYVSLYNPILLEHIYAWDVKERMYFGPIFRTWITRNWWEIVINCLIKVV